MLHQAMRIPRRIRHPVEAERQPHDNPSPHEIRNDDGGVARAICRSTEVWVGVGGAREERCGRRGRG